ncbi:MAG: hypothetical protein ACRYFX_27425 [Janthinobacterium lividum]
MDTIQTLFLPFGLGTVLLIAAFFLFGKRFIEEYSKNMVTKVFNESLVTETEKIKQEFRKDLEDTRRSIQIDLAHQIEPFKAALSRENISFQIINTEFNKLKFARLDSLYIKLNELKVFSQGNFLFPNDVQDAENRRQAFFSKYRETEVALHQVMLYVNDDVIVSAISMLDACQNAFSEFNKMTTSDRLAAQNSNSPELAEKFARQSGVAFEKLINSLDKLPSVLREIEEEFKRHITSTQTGAI